MNSKLRIPYAGRRPFFSALHVPPIESPAKAVRAAIVAEEPIARAIEDLRSAAAPNIGRAGNESFRPAGIRLVAYASPALIHFFAATSAARFEALSARVGGAVISSMVPSGSSK